MDHIKFKEGMLRYSCCSVWEFLFYFTAAFLFASLWKYGYNFPLLIPLILNYDWFYQSAVLVGSHYSPTSTSCCWWDLVRWREGMHYFISPTIIPQTRPTAVKNLNLFMCFVHVGSSIHIWRKNCNTICIHFGYFQSDILSVLSCSVQLV